MSKLKKLLAVALTATMVAGTTPVSTLPVQAAAPSFKVTTKKIALGKKYTLKIQNAKSGSTYKWKSSKPDIASVSTTGKITGLKTGKATIACTVTYPNKKTTKKLTAKVTITESAKGVSITGIKKGRTLGIGKKIYTYGAKTSTASKNVTTDTVYWFLTNNTAGASITKKGVVTTKNPGSFTIQAKTAASAAKKKKGIFTATSKAYTVDVPFELSSELTAINKVTLNMNYAIPNMSTSDVIITEKESGKQLPVQGLDISEDGLTVGVIMKNQFVSEREYEVTIPEFESADSFSSPIGDIANITLPDQTVLPGVATFIDYTVYDENGVDITVNYPWSELEASVSSSVTLTSEGQITLPSNGDSVRVTLNYDNGTNTISSNTATITAKNATIESMAAWTIVDGKSVPDWNNPVHNIAVTETGYKLYIRFKDSSGSYIDTYALVGETSYSSADANTLEVDSLGVLTPHQEGTVKISYTAKGYSGSVSVKVVSAKTVGSLSANTKDIVLSSDSSLGDYATVTFTLKDSDGNAMIPATKSTPTAVAAAGSENIVCVDIGESYTRPIGQSSTAVTKTTIDAASFQVKFKPYTSTGSGKVTVSYNGVSATVNVTVRTPGEKAGYAITLDNTVLNPNDNKTNTAIMYVYEVDSEGVKRALVSSSRNKFSITNSKGNVVLSETGLNLDGNNDGDIINVKQLELPDGVYTITAQIGTDTVTTTFSVETTVTATSLKVIKPSLSVKASDDVYTRILECVEVYVGNKLVNTDMSSCSFYAEQLNTVSNNIYANNYITKGIKTFGSPGSTVQYNVTKVLFTYMGTSYTIETDEVLTFYVSQY
jgi:hypothetical protein